VTERTLEIAMNTTAGFATSPINDMNAFTQNWAIDPRWKNVTRPYTPEAVLQLRQLQPVNDADKTRASQQLWAFLNGEAQDRNALKFDSCGLTMLGQTFNQARQAAEGSLSAFIIDAYSDQRSESPAAVRERIVEHLVAARLAADVAADPLLLVARITLNPVGADTVDAITVAYASAAYSDVILCEATLFDLDAATAFAKAVHRLYPQQLLMYRCTDAGAQGDLALGQQALFAAGFVTVQNTMSNGSVFEFQRVPPNPDHTGASNSVHGAIENIVKLSLEQGASTDLSDQIFFDETIVPDLQ
jgi:hypothetical protein